MTTVVVADDQALVRAGLRVILEAEGDIEVVGEALDGRDALQLVERTRPDVLLVDINMPVLDGIETTELLVRRGSPTRALVLTMYGQEENVYAALKAGASGFMLKTDPPEHLVHGVRVVAAGQSLLAPEVTRRLIERYVAGPAPQDGGRSRVDELSARERDVLRLIAAGMSNSEIAAALYVTAGTVKTHVTHILTKLGLRDRVQAAVFAYEHGCRPL